MMNIGLSLTDKKKLIINSPENRLTACKWGFSGNKVTEFWALLARAAQ